VKSHIYGTAAEMLCKHFILTSSPSSYVLWQLWDAPFCSWDNMIIHVVFCDTRVSMSCIREL
jgi:hypothetical protein